MSTENIIFSGMPSQEELDFLDLPAKTRAKLRYEVRNPDKVREHNKKQNERRTGQIKAWKDANPSNVQKHEKRRGDRNYHRPFVAIDAEGMDIECDYEIRKHNVVDTLGNPVARHDIIPHDQLKEIERSHPDENVYPKHRTILWGAKSWRRSYTASQLADNPILSRTNGECTQDYWLGSADKRPLSSLEILEWLTSLPEKFGPQNGYSDGVNFVMFSLNYDATQILAGLPFEKVYAINRRKTVKTKKDIKGSTFVGPYAIEYLKSKYLKVWKLRDPDNPRRIKTYKNGNIVYKDGKTDTELDYTAYINIQDAIGFYQEPFVKATESLVQNGYITKEQHDIIKHNKGKRDDFVNVPFEQIKTYCGLELEALSKALTVLRDGFDKMDIRLSAWSGSGAAAGAWIKKQKLKDEHYSPDISSTALTSQQKSAHHAFVGGRIELIKQGYAPNKKLWVYDIVSAYPAALVRLPSMKDGTWEHGEGLILSSKSSFGDWNMLSMFCVEWNFDHIDGSGLPVPFYPFPYRVKKKGQILFPDRGKAWIMRDELVAGIEWFRVMYPKRDISKCIRIKKWSRFYPANDEKPFKGIYELFRTRKEMKRLHDIAQKNIKLVINSLYGKTAQGVGSNDGPPSSACPYYAAATTAWCRARLLRFAIRDPHAIVSFMTDGIASTRKLHDEAHALDANVKPEGDDNAELGDWEWKSVAGGFFLMSGLYALLDEDGKAKTTKTRGYDPQKFLLGKEVLEFFTVDVLNTWKKPMLLAKDGKPIIEKLIYPINHYVTAGEACASRERFKLIGRWCKELRSFSVHEPGTKRTFEGLPKWAYMSPKITEGPSLKIPSLTELKLLEKWFDVTAKELQECLKAGEALRCRFLIPTLPADNPNYNSATCEVKLSAPSVPEWLSPDAGLGEPGEEEERGEIDIMEEGDLDTADIMAGMM